MVMADIAMALRAMADAVLEYIFLAYIVLIGHVMAHIAMWTRVDWV